MSTANPAATSSNPARLFVSNLAWSVKDNNLRESFSPFGDLVEVSVQRRTDGNSRGFAFVRYTNGKDAAKAREEMNGKILKERALQVEFAKSRPKRGKDTTPPKNKPKKRHKNSNGEVTKTPEKKEHEKICVKSTLFEVGSTLQLALMRLKNGEQPGKNRFRTSCVTLLKAFDFCLKAGEVNEDVKLFAQKLPSIFDQLCEIISLSYNAMKKSNKWSVNAQMPPDVAKSTIEKLFEAAFSARFSECASKLKIAYQKFEKCLMTHAIGWEEKYLESESAKIEEKTLESLCESVKSDESTVKKNDDTVGLIRDAISVDFPEVKIVKFGSCLTRLQFKTSDIDIGLDFSACPGVTTSSHDDKIQVLQTISKALRTKGIKNSLQKSRIPLIVLKKPHPPCDISVHNSENLLRGDLINSYLNVDKNVRPLIQLVKLWAKRRGICNAREGTLTSFGYTLCVIHYLQSTSPPVLPHFVIRDNKIVNEIDGEKFQSQNKKSLTELFDGFFSFYKDFEPHGQYITLSSNCDQNLDEMKFQSKQLKFLVIQDPIDPTDNCGRMIRKPIRRRILREIRRVHLLLCEGKDIGTVFAPVSVKEGPKYRKLFT